MFPPPQLSSTAMHHKLTCGILFILGCHLPTTGMQHTLPAASSIPPNTQLSWFHQAGVPQVGHGSAVHNPQLPSANVQHLQPPSLPHVSGRFVQINYNNFYFCRHPDCHAARPSLPSVLPRTLPHFSLDQPSNRSNTLLPPRLLFAEEKNDNEPPQALRPAPQKTFVCQLCPYTTDKESEYRNHIRRYMDKWPFECDYCGECFKKKRSLKVHKCTHEAEKPFECDQCQKRFARQDTLKKHALVHADKRHHGAKTQVQQKSRSRPALSSSTRR